MLKKGPIEKLEHTFDYGLKEISKFDHFNQIVDLENSSVYKKALATDNRLIY